MALAVAAILALVLLLRACLPPEDPQAIPDPPSGGADEESDTDTEPDAPSTSSPSTTDGTGTTEPDQQTPSDENGTEEIVPPVTGPQDQASGALPVEVVDELIDFVERERGHDFVTRPVVEVLDDDAFELQLLEDFDEERESISQAESVLRSLRLLAPSNDLYTLMAQLYQGAVVGFYDPETEELVVRGVKDTPYVRSVLVHELTHALDDQIFDLDRPELEDPAGEESFAFSALVEGSARYVEDRYLDTLSFEERQQVFIEEQTAVAEGDFGNFPPVLLEQLGAPYTHGLAFVTEIADDGSLDALDEAYEAPPISSEHILEPRTFLDREPPHIVEAPAADGEIVDEGTLGQIMLQLLLEQVGIFGAQAEDAASGWGGDRYVTWNTGDRRSCIRVNVTMDSNQDLLELTNALQSWTRAHGSASLAVVADRLTLDACG